MKKRTKLSILGIGVLAATLLLSGCTQSFCTNNDKAHILYALDYGVCDYYDHEVENSKRVFPDNPNIYYTVNIPTHESSGIGKANADATKAGLQTPTSDYYVKMDQMVLENALKANRADVNFNTVEYSELLKALDKFGYLKFIDGDSLWASWDALNANIRAQAAIPGSGIVLDDLPTNDYITIYKNDMTALTNNYRSCISIKDDNYGYYGYPGGANYRKDIAVNLHGVDPETYDGKMSTWIEEKTWGYAWNVGGKFTFFEGLLVYPIAWLTETFVSGFKNIGVMGGLAQLLAIFAITFIVRSLMLLVTIKQTAGNAKMQALQPEITKIQNKYPNANTNNYEKQMMAQEMSKLYKKNKINPLSTLLVMIVQFPVFICVWGALQGCASLSSDSFLNLHLSDNINTTLFNGANWANGSAVTALFLFLFMAAAQVIAMLLPQWIQKAKRKKVASLGKNPAQNDQQSKMRMFTYVMMAMIIFMGFMLPSAMGVYWFVGALFSIGQTLIIEKINSARAKKKGH